MISFSSIVSFCSRFVWFLPFAFFLAGYSVIQIVLRPSKLATPTVLGKPLPEAVQILSSQQLNVRLLGTREQDTVAPGTVISQNPSPKSSIRPQQTVFLITSCKKQKQSIPTCVGNCYKNCIEELKKDHIFYKLFFLPSNQPEETVIAQLPGPEETDTLTDKPLVLYVSGGSRQSQVLVPSFKNKSVSEVKTFLERAQVPFSVFHSTTNDSHHDCSDCRVVEQKPLAGSFIDEKNPPTIQLRVND